MRSRMVVILIGLVVLMCTLANANESNNDYNCNSEYGMGTCKSYSTCEAFVNNQIPYENLRRCPISGSIPTICCPKFNQSPRLTVEAPPLPTAQRTNTNQLNPIERRSKRDQISSAVRNVCDTISKTGYCNENSFCISTIGNGTCTQRRNCESYTSYRISQWSFNHCNAGTICCVSTTTVATRTRPHIDTNIFVSNMKGTAFTSLTTTPRVPVQQSEENSPISSRVVGSTCNTILRTGSCYENNSCVSKLGNGTCKPRYKCEPYRAGNIPSSDVIPCNRLTICCVPANADNLAAVLGRSCNNLSGPGTCKNITQCEPFLQRKVESREMTRCGVPFILCCPNSIPGWRPMPNGGITPTMATPKSPEGNYCYIHPGSSGLCTVLHQCQSFLQGAVRNETLQRCSHPSNPTIDIVCCPPVTPTSATPRTFTTTTRRTQAISKREPQLRPAEQVCAIYKARNPKRQLIHMTGEKEARNGEFPHVGIVIGANSDGRSNRMLYCGAALIAQRFALTTSNCARSLPLESVVRFGSVSTDPNERSDQRLDAKVKNIWISDDNKATEDYHDLALLEFQVGIPLLRSVHPACLRVEEADLPRSVDLQVNGWTTNNASNDFMSPVLYTSTRNTLAVVSCNFTHYEGGVSRRSMKGVIGGQYCTRNTKLGQCDGDLGFPLSMDTAGQFEIVGILSLEYGCNSELPSIYTRVAHYIDWIEQIVWPDLTEEYIARQNNE